MSCLSELELIVRLIALYKFIYYIIIISLSPNEWKVH